MRYLLDTQLLVWATYDDARLPPQARALCDDPAADLAFSVVSLWECVIKSSLGRADFRADARAMRPALTAVGYGELVVTAEHVFALEALPALHRDPFDRLLIAQARAEGMTLITTDRALCAYGPPVDCVI